MSEPKRLSMESDSDMGRLLLGAGRARAPRAARERAIAAASAAVATAGLTSGSAAASGALAKAGSAAALKWLVVLGLAGGAIAGGVLYGRPPGTRPVEPAIAVAPPRAPASPVVAPSPAPAERFEPSESEPIAHGVASSVAPPPAVVAPHRLSPPTAEVTSGSMLPEELSLLERARGAIAAGDPARALSVLDAYTARFAHPVMLPEATMLRIEALLDAGDRPAAERTANAFRASHPQSPYAARIRSLLGASNP